MFWGILGRCNISTRAAIRVVQRVVGDCVNGEGSRVRVKLYNSRLEPVQLFVLKVQGNCYYYKDIILHPVLGVRPKKKVAFVKRPKKLPQQKNVDLLHEKNDASIYGFKHKGNSIPEKKCNNLKDFLNVAGPMGVAHFLMPSKTVSSPDLRVASTMGATDALWHIYSLGSFNTICDATQ
ncbi:hypothetical protein Tco_1280269, partial [Tanacetum coccineum]